MDILKLMGHDKIMRGILKCLELNMVMKIVVGHSERE